MKRFREWMALKAELHEQERQPTINEGEIWWCSIGENVKTEIYGKNDKFDRPVIILKKYNRENFLGVPLTSKEKKGSWYVNFKFNGRLETANLSQIRSMNSVRLYKKFGELPEQTMHKIWKSFYRLHRYR